MFLRYRCHRHRLKDLYWRTSLRAYDRVRGALGTGAVGVGVDVVDGGFVGGCVVQAMWSQGLRCVIPSVQVSSVRVQGSGTFGSDELVSLESVLLSGLTLEVYRYRYNLRRSRILQ